MEFIQRHTQAAKESPIEGVPVVPPPLGMSMIPWCSGPWHFYQLQNDFQRALDEFTMQHADDNGRVAFWMGLSSPGLSVTHFEDVQTLLKVSSPVPPSSLSQRHFDKILGNYHIGSSSQQSKSFQKQQMALLHALASSNQNSSALAKHNHLAFSQAAQTLATSLQEHDVDLVYDIQNIMRILVLEGYGWAWMERSSLGGARKCKLKPSRFAKDWEFLYQDLVRRTQHIWSRINPASQVYELPTYVNRKQEAILDRLNDFLLDIVERRKHQILAEAGSENDTTTTSTTDEEASSQRPSYPQDILTAMMKGWIQSLDENDENMMDSDLMDEMIVDTLKSLLWEGHEATSITLTYVLYLLSKHPDVEERCLEEIESLSETYGNDDESSSSFLFSRRFVYLEAVIKETLRLFPPVISISRQLDKEVRFSNLHLPANTFLYFSLWGLQRSEHHFAWPLKFIPERWVRYDPDQMYWIQRDYPETHQEDFEGVPAGNPKAWVPFSSSLGGASGQQQQQQMAMVQMTTALRYLLPLFHFKVPDDYKLRIQYNGFLQSPKDGIPMKIQPRKPSSPNARQKRDQEQRRSESLVLSP